MKKINPVVVLLVAALTIAVNPLPAQEPDKAAALAAGFESGSFELSNYNTACYFALAGNKNLALTFLRKAVADGFSDVRNFQADTDLFSLHNESEWGGLVSKVAANAEGKNGGSQLFFNQSGFWDSRFFKTPYRESIPEDERVAGLSKFWSEAKYNFVNFDLVPDLDIDSLYFAYLPRVKAVTSTLEYYKVLAEMCAQLKDGHTNIFPPDDLYNRVYSRPLIRTRLTEGKVIILDVDKSLDKHHLKKGFEVVTVNGMPVKQYALENVTPYQSSSTPQDRDIRSYDYALLSGDIEQPVRLKVRDARGITYDDTIYRVTPVERSRKITFPPVDFKTLPGGISYLAINSFGDDTGTRVFVKNYPEISKSRALIIDLRNNGGGNTDWTILRYLIDSPALVHKMYSRQYIPTHRAWERKQATWQSSDGITPIKGERFKGRVIVLVSARTFSAAEDFAAAFKSLKRGLIVGEATGGSTGQPLFINLTGGLNARICTKRDQFPNGDDFVGKGIVPDISVEQTINDVRKGVDTQLEAALKELKK